MAFDRSVEKIGKKRRIYSVSGPRVNLTYFSNTVSQSHAMESTEAQNRVHFTFANKGFQVFTCFCNRLHSAGLLHVYLLSVPQLATKPYKLYWPGATAVYNNTMTCKKNAYIV